jgi:hypothetical protein
MHRKELVAMLMESPFYFDMILQDRLKLIQVHMDRFSPKGHEISNHFHKITKHPTQNDAEGVTKIIVGYFPP